MCLISLNVNKFNYDVISTQILIQIKVKTKDFYDIVIV